MGTLLNTAPILPLQHHPSSSPRGLLCSKASGTRGDGARGANVGCSSSTQHRVKHPLLITQ